MRTVKELREWAKVIPEDYLVSFGDDALRCYRDDYVLVAYLDVADPRYDRQSKEVLAQRSE